MTMTTSICNYRKTKNDKRFFLRSFFPHTSFTPRDVAQTPPTIHYNEFDASTGRCSLQIDEETFNTGIEITKEEFHASISALRRA